MSTTTTISTNNIQAEVIDPRLINPKTGNQYKGKALASRLAEIQKLEEEGKAITIAMTLQDETTEPTAMAVAPEEKEAPVANPQPTSTVVVDGLCALYTEAFVASKARMFEEAKKRHDSATAEYAAAFAAFEGMKESDKGYPKAKKRQEQAKNGLDSRFNVMMAAQNAATQAKEKCIALFSRRDALEVSLKAYQAIKAQKVGEDKAEKSAAQKNLQEAFKSLQDDGLALLELAKHLAKKEDFLTDPIKVGEAMVEQLSGAHLQASISALQPKVVQTVVKEKAEKAQPVKPQLLPKKEKKENPAEARLKRADLLKEQGKLVESAHNSLIGLAQTAPSSEVCETIDEELKLLATIKATAERWIAGDKESSFSKLEVREIKRQIDAEASRIIAWAKRSQPVLSMPNFGAMLKPCGWNSPGAAYVSLEEMHQAIQNMMADGAEGSAEQALAKHLLAKGRCPTLESAKAAHEAALKFDGTWEQAEALMAQAEWDEIEAEYEREMDDLQDAFYESGLSAALHKEPAPIPAAAPVTETPEVAATVAASNPEKEAQMSPFETFCATSGATEDEVLAVICRITGQKLSARAELTEKNQRKLDRATLETLQGALVAHRKSKAEENDRVVRKALKKGEKEAKKAQDKKVLKKSEYLVLAYDAASAGNFYKAAKLLRQAGEVVPVLSTDDFVTLVLFDAMVWKNVLPEVVALPDDETVLEIMAINASIFKRVWSRAKGGVKKAANKVKGFFRKEPKAEPKAEGEKKESKPTLRERFASFKESIRGEKQASMTRFERAKKDLADAGKDALVGGAFTVGGAAVAVGCAVGAPIWGVGAAWSLIRGRKDEAKARIKKAGLCLTGVGVGAIVGAVGVVTATLGVAVDLLSSAYNAVVGVGKAIGSFFKGLFSKKAEVAAPVAAAV